MPESRLPPSMEIGNFAKALEKNDGNVRVFERYRAMGEREYPFDGTTAEAYVEHNI